MLLLFIIIPPLFIIPSSFFQLFLLLSSKSLHSFIKKIVVVVFCSSPPPLFIIIIIDFSPLRLFSCKIRLPFTGGNTTSGVRRRKTMMAPCYDMLLPCAVLFALRLCAVDKREGGDVVERRFARTL